MKIVCVSDTHNMMSKIDVPDGDVLIHCGDATNSGELRAVSRFNEDLKKLPHKYKLFTPGNHDFIFQNQPALARATLSEATTLIDQSIEIDGLRIHMSPWSVDFCNWAFMREDDELNDYWGMIPDGVDIVVTHSPPHGILDFTRSKDHAGSKSLLKRIYEVKPKYHLFGHIHEGYGVREYDGICFMNVASLDDCYQPVNKAVVIEI